MPKSYCLACEKNVAKRGRRRCPACGLALKGSGWDGIDAHWRARHAELMPYEDFWTALCKPHRAARAQDCPSCVKGIPTEWPCQCPECAQVFRGKAWEGIEAHWQAHHADVASYQEFLSSLCPAHRRAGDKSSGYLRFG